MNDRFGALNDKVGGLTDRVGTLESVDHSKEHVPITIVKEVETKVTEPVVVQAPAVQAEVTEAMFLQLKNLVNVYHDEHDKDIADLRDKDKKTGIRLSDLESQLELLKKMNRPAGDDGADLLDALNEITDKIRKEFDEKLDALRDELLKRIEALEQESREKDTDL